jgi:hypothetical protein
MTFDEFPLPVQKEIVQTAAEQVGKGYVLDYYIQIAQDWLWLYELGLKDGKKARPK